MENKSYISNLVLSTTLISLALALTACGAEASAPPNVVLEIKVCGGTATVQIPKSKLLQLSVPGKTATVTLNKDGTVTIGEVTISSGSDAAIGDPKQNHMDVKLGTNNEISVTSDCPAPLPPTIAPSSPSSFHGSGKYAAYKNGAMAFTSKPMRGNVYSRRG